MKVIVTDFAALLQKLHPESLNTKQFEIYYDLTRLLDIPISKEACFRLYTKYSDNYGKMKDYLCILGNKPADKKKFDDEFFRRIKQLYFNQPDDVLQHIKDEILWKYGELTASSLTGLICVHNHEFIAYTLNFLEIQKYFNSIKISEYLNDYDTYIDEIFSENIIESNPPEKIVFVFATHQEDYPVFVRSQEKYKKYAIEFENFDSVS